MVDASVVEAVRRYLEAVQTNGIPVRFGVVFGSYADGRADQWSDIDLVVVSPTFDAPRDRRDVDLLWRLSARIDSRIEPIPCGETQWETDDESAIVEVARRHGERVTV
ncbi:MAG: nucleotidyltransferase domain-containing protein [Deferrisomatales bacterium]